MFVLCMCQCCVYVKKISFSLAYGKFAETRGENIYQRMLVV